MTRAGLALRVAAACAALLLAACAGQPRGTRTGIDRAEVEREVAATERAFARTMADRDLQAFARFIAPDAVFFSGAKVLRGRQAVLDGWRALYAAPTAPFSWEPAQVEALESGDLALSTGPVRDTDGKIVAQFTTIWRREAPHTWRVVYDKGNDVCECAAPTT
jgi:ketosteroid isomerase-like protein